MPGVGDGALLDVVPGEAIDALVAVSGADTPLLSVELRHLGGAVGRAPEGHGALAALEGDFALFAVGIAPHPATVAAMKVGASLAAPSERITITFCVPARPSFTSSW